MGAKKKSWEEKFWNKIDKNGPEVRPGLGPCWIWTGGRLQGKGYGRLSHLGKGLYAHRVSLAFKIKRNLLPGEETMHACDNPPCCNPKHLKVGTAQQNADEKMERGRYTIRCGEQVPQSKLREKDVKTIRNSSQKGTDLAKFFGVAPSCISKIRNRRIWKHV